MKTLLNYSKQQTIEQAFGGDVLAHGVQVLRFNGAGNAEPVAWIDEEPLEVLRALDRNQAKLQFRVIVLDWNCLIIVCKQQDRAEQQLQTLQAEDDPNLEYFHNCPNKSLREQVRRFNRWHSSVSNDGEQSW